MASLIFKTPDVREYLYRGVLFTLTRIPPRAERVGYHLRVTPERWRTPDGATFERIGLAVAHTMRRIAS